MLPFTRVTAEMPGCSPASAEPLLPIPLPLATADEPFLPLLLDGAASHERRR